MTNRVAHFSLDDGFTHAHGARFTRTLTNTFSNPQRARAVTVREPFCSNRFDFHLLCKCTGIEKDIAARKRFYVC